ncbi:MAG: hypothetical protein HY692_05890 [Cyanobacteria bacterium NC_groundwater_1444_Ag_S-0.65um_54_12]|nr:hypothetical protein [Cyanobacteria bacterium NC_groundwater_1444_Ag_S-0.65um_54_12]
MSFAVSSGEKKLKTINPRAGGTSSKPNSNESREKQQRSPSLKDDLKLRYQDLAAHAFSVRSYENPHPGPFESGTRRTVGPVGPLSIIGAISGFCVGGYVPQAIKGIQKVPNFKQGWGVIGAAIGALLLGGLPFLAVTLDARKGIPHKPFDQASDEKSDR